MSVGEVLAPALEKAGGSSESGDGRADAASSDGMTAVSLGTPSRSRTVKGVSEGTVTLSFMPQFMHCGKYFWESRFCCTFLPIVVQVAYIDLPSIAAPRVGPHGICRIS
jgi:hypothetical protein